MAQTTWPRILLVQDDPGNLATSTTALGEAGHDVVVCLSIAEAMTSAKREPFAVALIDMQQPDETGVALLRNLRRMNGQIQVVLNAAFQSFPLVIDATQGQTLTYFEKAASAQWS